MASLRASALKQSYEKQRKSPSMENYSIGTRKLIPHSPKKVTKADDKLEHL